MTSFDTSQANRGEGLFADREQLWLFGYGSLIHRAGFDYLERRAARIDGWQRRFWQGSHDHRGTSAAPGRVVTLVQAPGAVCAGMAYRITPAVFGYLDQREKNGYRRVAVDMTFHDGAAERGLVYLATPDNPAWLGPASPRAIAQRIATSSGPSGPNRDYLLALADALRALGAEDAHVFAVEHQLRALEAGCAGSS